MLQALARRVQSVVVAGDPLQAIYGWAGSRYTQFAPPSLEVQRLTMNRSYRLPAPIAALACSTMGRSLDAIHTGHGGANASANLYSLVETAKANGIEPYRYVVALCKRLPLAQTAGDYEALLPWNIALLRA